MHFYLLRYIDSRQAEKREEKNAREKVLQKLEQDKVCFFHHCLLCYITSRRFFLSSIIKIKIVFLKTAKNLNFPQIERKRNLGMTSERLATKPTATGTGEKDEFNPQNSLPAISVGIAVSMRECLRSLKHHRKVMIYMENVVGCFLMKHFNKFY